VYEVRNTMLVLRKINNKQQKPLSKARIIVTGRNYKQLSVADCPRRKLVKVK
jgi:hypothetical protein